MQPTQLGPYRIRSRLGRGGMGTVYEAEDTATGRLVAVKTLAAHLGDDAGLRRRFSGEIDTLKALRHPGIVRLLAFGEDDGAPFFAMELVRGRSLEDLLRSGRRFSWRETVGVGLEIVRALKSAHDHGVVHRDLKPANLLLLDEPADGATVKLADFGIARLFGDAGQTLAGTVVGTAEYMAPEQAAGKAVDHRADLYALGLVLFAMLTGKPPFHGSDVVNVLDRQRRESPPRLAAVLPGVPPELDDLVARLLAKDPARRPANALSVGRLLSAIEAAGGAAAQPPAPAADHLGATLAMSAAATNGPGIDAATRPNLTPTPAAEAVPVATVVATSAAGSAFARQPTVPIPEGVPAAAASANRFTTVEELHREVRAREARDRRRQRLVQALAAVVTLAAVAACGFWLFRPHTADELHSRIMAIASDPSADLRDARPLIDSFLARHGPDPRAVAVGDLGRSLDLDALERRSRRRPRAGRPLAPIERDYRAAMEREAGSPAGCVAALEAILAVHAVGPPAASPATGEAAGETEALWLALVRRQIDRLAPLAAKEQEEDAARAAATLAQAAALATEAAAAPDAASREPLLARRRDLLESIVEIYASRPHAESIVAEARRLLDADPVPPAP
jgi:hypothetical protein